MTVRHTAQHNLLLYYEAAPQTPAGDMLLRHLLADVRERACKRSVLLHLRNAESENVH